MHPDYKKELEYLESVIKEINNELILKFENKHKLKRKTREINKNMWEEVGPLSGHSTLESTPSFLQDEMLLKQTLIAEAENLKKIKMLDKQLYSPYFCRIDFKEDDYEIESFYIGIYGLRVENTGNIMVYDWRAPISSIFYDFEIGKASYECLDGTIEGDLLQKRQYRVENGKLKYMFDSNVAIEDDILQDILGKSADTKMKVIVNTIQKEQNRAIRYEGKKILLVQGPAGSGKTSIALHRIAYLLYKNRKSLKSDNILFFTPNGAFINYISSVLPELGEETLKCITLLSFCKNVLNNDEIQYESYSEMMEWKLSQNEVGIFENRMKSIKFKSSYLFVNIIEKFIEYFEKNCIKFDDIKYKEITLFSKVDLDNLYFDTFAYMPLNKRLQRMEQVVLKEIELYEKERIGTLSEELSNDSQYISEAERKAVSRVSIKKELVNLQELVKTIFAINILDIYLLMFKNNDFNNENDNILSKEIREKTIVSLENKVLLFEDQAPILYIMTRIGLIDSNRNIKHVFIDEAQDYSVVAFKLFSEIYKESKFTIVGDINQNINPIAGIGGLESIGEILDINNFKYIELDKSYRTTCEIMEFALKILPSNIKPYGRHGNKPTLHESSNIESLCSLIKEFIQKNDNVFKSFAVICRTLSDCKRIASNLDCVFNIVENSEDEIPIGVNILPSYFSKGLEFDAVMVLFLSEDDYWHNEDELLYTACTRALHNLEIYSLNTNKKFTQLKSALDS